MKFAYSAPFSASFYWQSVIINTILHYLIGYKLFDYMLSIISLVIDFKRMQLHFFGFRKSMFWFFVNKTKTIKDRLIILSKIDSLINF